MKFAGISKSLKEGCRIHAFRSGGGLRVVRIEKAGDLKGYGEHPQIGKALSHANRDFLAGGRPYNKVYGKSEPHYLTGSASATSPLDLWILQGHTFDVWQSKDGIVVELKGLKQVEAPEEIHKRVLLTGTPETWQHRGYTYYIKRCYFPSGGPGVEWRVVKRPQGEKDRLGAIMYHVSRTGRGACFATAMANAFKADEVEVVRE